MFSKKPDKLNREPGETYNGQLPERVADPKAKVLNVNKSTPAWQSGTVKGAKCMESSIIGADLVLMGNAISKGEIQVDGEVQGDIHCASLVVGEQARIAGGIIAEDVVIRGKVMGSIRGLRISLQSSSHVEGDIFHQSLAIEQGAYFEGKSRRVEDPIASPPKGEQSINEAISLSAPTVNGSGTATMGMDIGNPAILE